MHKHNSHGLAFNILMLPLFLKRGLTIPVTQAALSNQKRHLEGWYVQGEELTGELAPQSLVLPLTFMDTIPTQRHHIRAAAKQEEEKDVTEQLPHMPFLFTPL